MPNLILCKLDLLIYYLSNTGNWFCHAIWPMLCINESNSEECWELCFRTEA